MLEHLYAALQQTEGVCLKTSDREALRQKLYAARRDAADPDLSGLSIVFSPTSEEEVWIIHNSSRTSNESP